MRIAFALYDWFPFGGLERDCLAIAQLCAKAGHEVVMLARTWDGPRPHGIEVRTFGRSGWTIPMRNRRFFAQLREVREREQFDGIVGFNKLPGIDVYYGADACYAAGAYAMPKWKRWLPRHRHYLAVERAVFARERGVVALQYFDRDIEAYQQSYGTAREQFVVLPPNAERIPYDDSDREQARSTTRAELGADAHELLLLCVGSAFVRKGFDRAVDALASLRGELRQRARLVVLGRDDAKVLTQHAARLGIRDRVHVLGGRTDAPRWFLGADLLLHPARSENAGAVIVEAMHFGLPSVVTARCGYASHVIAADAGIALADPFDQRALDAALLRGLDESTRATWKANALRHAATGAIYGCRERAAEAILAAIAAKRRNAVV